MFGHELDKDILEDCAEVVPKDPWTRTFWKNFYLSPYMIYPQYFLKRCDTDVHRYRFILDQKFNSSKEMFAAIMAGLWETVEVYTIRV